MYPEILFREHFRGQNAPTADVKGSTDQPEVPQNFFDPPSFIIFTSIRSPQQAPFLLYPSYTLHSLLSWSRPLETRQ